MAYSDTYGQVYPVQVLIDHAARRCGKLAEELTSEQLVTAREALGFVMTNLINIGIQYWAIQKEVIGLTPNKYIYTLPVGSNDVLNALYRTMNRPTGSYSSSAGGNAALAGDNDIDTYCQQTSANGNIAINFGTSNPIYAGSIGILPFVSGGGSATWTLILEYSSDGTNWNTLEDIGTVVVTDNQWKWYDIDPGQSVQYYRIRASGGTILALREFYVGNNSREITMSRLNRDDYTNLPNKNFTANQPYQFWFNRTIPQPEIYLWPTPSNPFVQMTVWYSKQIMDVGDLTDELQIPQRWYMATLAMLSHQLALELPAVPLDRVQYLESQAEKYLNQAEQEERDRSPIYFAPNLSVYNA
ncbi:MAG: discoidin domain-containing protein [Betaproteobacteria bacterium]|nr:discoidin domain-containing protein [Betaproteobacteria bacterium]